MYLQFKLLFSGNHKPSLRNVGVAMQRRINMIDFAVVIPESDRDPQFADKLRPEWPGILKWMIEGCLDWRRRGLDPPGAVKKATADYFMTQDSFSNWIDDRCERDPKSMDEDDWNYSRRGKSGPNGRAFVTATSRPSATA